MIVVEAPGPLTTVQDLGRPGLAHLGVGRSGAADRAAFALANRLVGNDAAAAGLEVTLGGLVLRFERTATVAVTGAPCRVRLAGRDEGQNAVLWVPAGATLALALSRRGIRTYLAVRGGIDVPPVLGSRSTDLLAGLGPERLATGMRLGVGSAGGPHPRVDQAAVRRRDDGVLRVLPGPRDDWFTPDSLARLVSGTYEVTPASDRVGVRLHGARLERCRAGELPSEGMVEGALQVPPDGQPVLFLADHPVTGGYPVVGVVDPEDLGLAAQARPGDRLGFRWARA